MRTAGYHADVRLGPEKGPYAIVYVSLWRRERVACSPSRHEWKSHLPQRQQQTRRRTEFLAGTVAPLLFFTTTGIIHERMVASMMWEQVFHARL